MRLRTLRRSLLGRLAVGLVFATLVSLAAGTGLLYLEFRSFNSALRDNTMESQSRDLASAFTVRGLAPGHSLNLPRVATDPILGDTGRYVLLDGTGHVAAATPGQIDPLVPFDPALTAPRLFALRREAADPVLYGIVRPIGIAGHPFWLQVAFDLRSDLPFDEMLSEFIVDIGWVWIPLMALWLVINLLIVRLGLRPLDRAVRQIGTIGPDSISKRLPTQEMPTELLPFVSAVNRALGRLEEGYASQRAFIADAAHELRTPLAVLKAHLDILPDRATALSLSEDVETMERLVGQLLDLAKLGALRLVPGETADLAAIARDVATRLAPIAISRNRSLAVDAPETEIRIAGSADFLFRAVRNLVENGLNHTPPNTIVTLTVTEQASLSVADCGPGIPIDQRSQIFQRFWQGDRRKGNGAGLGMAIVARTAEAHGAKVTIDDSEPQGAKITLSFPVTEPA